MLSSCGHKLLSCSHKLVSGGHKLLSRGHKLLSRGHMLLSHSHKLVSFYQKLVIKSALQQNMLKRFEKVSVCSHIHNNGMLQATAVDCKQKNK